MKKGIGKFLLLVSLLLIAYGAYLVWDEENSGKWSSTCCEHDEYESGDDDNNKESPTNDSLIIETKKKDYLNSGSAFINAVSISVSMGFDENLMFINNPMMAYYIPVSNLSNKSCVMLDKGGMSPFGEWEYAYVVVTLNGSGSYSYSFVALDKAGYGLLPVKEGTSEWSAASVKKGIVPVIPKTGDTITSIILPTETRTGIKAVIVTVKDGTCTVPNI